MTIALDFQTYGRLRPRPEYYNGSELKLPSWMRKLRKNGSLRNLLFTYEGIVWKVVLEGSHNNTPRSATFVNFVRAVPYNQSVEKLVGEGSSLDDLASSLQRVQSQGRVFTPDMLAYAKLFQLSAVPSHSEV